MFMPNDPIVAGFVIREGCHFYFLSFKNEQESFHTIYFPSVSIACIH